MNRTFASEDARKTTLFEAWIAYLSKIHHQLRHDESFEEIYEGTADVSDLSRNRIGFLLEDGRNLRHIPISQEISAQSCRLDTMYIVIGRRQGKWWPLDVISIGTVLEGKPARVHVTFNPLHICAVAQSAVVQ